jgi:glycosyltransferase involved in cell wall biosynthesis
MTLNPDTPFVVFGDDWGRYPSSMQHTFRHIAKWHPVVWVNAIGHRVPGLNAADLSRAWDKVRRLATKRSAAPQPGKATLDGAAPVAIIEPRVLPWHHWRIVHRLNTWSLTRAIQNRLKSLRLTEPPVLVTGSPPSVGVLGRLNERASVYFCMDDFLNFPTVTASMIAPLERRLLEKVDLVVATAASLTKSKRPRSGAAYHLPQGVNFDHFAEPRAEPPDLAGIPRPRIGFAGSLSTQCDVDLLVRLATAFPDASLVLVGPVGLDRAELDRLHLPNVHILGVRSYEDLPAYVQHFDVGIIPYVLSAWTVAVDPLKLLEYLAAGLPVVTTAIPEAAKYAETVAVAADSDAFVTAVREALSSNRESARRRGQALAREHTWERRARTFLAMVAKAAEEPEKEETVGAGAPPG